MILAITHYIGELEGHHFAITEFISGISLRDFLLSNAPDAIGALMSEVGYDAFKNHSI
jgi:hypothetical protein